MIKQNITLKIVKPMEKVPDKNIKLLVINSYQ